VDDTLEDVHLLSFEEESEVEISDEESFCRWYISYARVQIAHAPHGIRTRHCVTIIGLHARICVHIIARTHVLRSPVSYLQCDAETSTQHWLSSLSRLHLRFTLADTVLSLKLPHGSHFFLFLFRLSYATSMRFADDLEISLSLLFNYIHTFLSLSRHH
jgi:hypothetical protein